jgi:hypothetical protein
MEKAPTSLKYSLIIMEKLTEQLKESSTSITMTIYKETVEATDINDN